MHDSYKKDFKTFSPFTKWLTVLFLVTQGKLMVAMPPDTIPWKRLVCSILRQRTGHISKTSNAGFHLVGFVRRFLGISEITFEPLVDA